MTKDPNVDKSDKLERIERLERIEKNIPDIAVRRLSIYCRYLEELEEMGRQTVSSDELAELVGIKATQLRKDLTYFGQFGVRGKGYAVSELRRKLCEIIGTDQRWNVVLVGVGSLGLALAHYKGFRKHGVNIMAAFDSDQAKVGKAAGELIIRPFSTLKDYLAIENVQIAILAVPGPVAQSVADHLIENGVRAIMNFAPIRLRVPAEVKIYNVDLSIALETLTYHLTADH